MSSAKVLSVENVRRITGVTGKMDKKIRWHTDELTIHRFLPLNEFIRTVQNIIRDCTSKDGTFVPELLDFAIRMNIIGSYAAVELPEDMDIAYYIVYASDLYDTICSNANTAQIDAIRSSVSIYLNGGV